MLLRGVGGAREVSGIARRLRRDRRRLARVCVRADGRSIRRARELGETQARRTAVGVREAPMSRDARRRPRAVAHP